MAEEAMALNDDGTITLEWDGQSYHLRRPKIGEWRTILEAAEAADRATAETDSVASLIYGKEAPYAKVVVLALTTLADLNGSKPPKPDDLPMWCAQGTVIGQMASHWRTIPLAHSNPPLSSPESQSPL